MKKQLLTRSQIHAEAARRGANWLHLALPHPVTQPELWEVSFHRKSPVGHAHGYVPLSCFATPAEVEANAEA